MTDIVERLRLQSLHEGNNFLMDEAATVIADLRFAGLALDEVNERLREELADVRADAALLRAEVERLRALVDDFGELLKQDAAEIERLRAALKELLSYWDDDAYLSDGALDRARRTLEPKP